MKFKKSIIALLLAVSIFLLNLPQVPVAAGEDNNLTIQIGEKMTFDEGTLLKASEDLYWQQDYYFSENSSSVAQYCSIEGNSHYGYLLPNYSQLSSEYKIALEASGYILPGDGKIKWVVERKEDRVVEKETWGSDAPYTYYINYPVYKIYPYILHDVSVDKNIANGSIIADKPNATGGETVTLTVAANDTYQLESVTVKDKNNNNITLSGSGNTRTFTMPESNVSINGSFSKILYNHSVQVDSNIENGSIKVDKPNPTKGETVTITIMPSDNYQLESITVGNVISLLGSGNTRTFIMPESNVWITGSFSKLAHNVQVDESIKNGSIVADKPNAISGQIVTLTAVPGNDYQLESIMVKDANNNDIALLGTGNTRTFTMPESNVSVNGSFVKRPYNVEVQSNIANGKITVDKPYATSGETVIIKIEPSNNYELENITINNIISLLGTGNTRTFTMSESNVLITGSFSEILPAVDNVVLTPETAVVQKGKMQAFTASVIGTNNPDKSVKWSIEGASSNSTTISESGVLQVSSDEMSSTINVKATSILDNTKSLVAAVKVIRANLIPDTKNNTIGGIKEGDSYIAGTEIGFAAVGGGMDNTAPISGDVRYVPISWSANSSGEWTTAPYTAKFTINNVGNYTLKVSYQKQTFNGTSWENIANEIDTKIVSFSITNKPSNDQKPPNSGDQASTLFFLCVGLIAAVSTKHMYLIKKKL